MATVIDFWVWPLSEDNIYIYQSQDHWENVLLTTLQYGYDNKLRPSTFLFQSLLNKVVNKLVAHDHNHAHLTMLSPHIATYV